MTRLLALWKKEWLALWRDKHGLLALFVMPAIFILLMSLALQDAFAPDKPLDLGYAVADLDRHAAVEAVGYGLGAFAGFEAFNGRLVDYVVGTWGLGHGGDDVADVEVFDDFAVLAECFVCYFQNLHCVGAPFVQLV